MFKRSVFLSSLIFILSFCSPGLGTTMSLNNVSKVELETSNLFTEQDKVRLNILNFGDNRTIEAIAQIDGRLIKPDGDVGQAAQRIFESYAKNSGIKLSLFNAPTVRGYVNEWKVSIIPSFPASKVQANATINIELLDRDSNIIHKSFYSGDFQEANPFLSDEKVQNALGMAMSYAVSEVFKDQLFISRLNAAANFSNELNY